jgi:hypothetical protein
MSLADLVHRPRTAASRPASRLGGAASPGTGRSSAAGHYPPISGPARTPAAKAMLGHARRGSRDVTGLTVGDDSPSLRASRMRKDVGAPAPRASVAAARTPLRRPLGSTVQATSGKSLNMMHVLQSRMRALESRISSARDLSRIAPAVDLDRSAIPRPASRLGSSTGPGAYGSPTPTGTPGPPVRGPRPSFDGKASVSGIPVPPSGLSKSTRRPASRLSMASGGIGSSSSPPLPSAQLPRSQTPTFSAGAHGGVRGASPLGFLDSEPDMHSGRASAASVRRRITTVGERGASTRPRGSTTVGLSTAEAKGAPAGGVVSALRAPSSRPLSGTTAAGAAAGPPVSWRPTASGRLRSSSTGSR